MTEHSPSPQIMLAHMRETSRLSTIHVTYFRLFSVHHISSSCWQSQTSIEILSSLFLSVSALISNLSNVYKSTGHLKVKYAHF